LCANCGHIKHKRDGPSEDYYHPSTTERKKNSYHLSRYSNAALSGADFFEKINRMLKKYINTR
jgi:hypothetical protein